jgi:hypothetical protein
VGVRRSLTAPAHGLRIKRSCFTLPLRNRDRT